MSKNIHYIEVATLPNIFNTDFVKFLERNVKCGVVNTRWS